MVKCSFLWYLQEINWASLLITPFPLLPLPAQAHPCSIGEQRELRFWAMLRFDLIMHFPVVNFWEAGLFVVKDSKVMSIMLKTDG